MSLSSLPLTPISIPPVLSNPLVTSTDTSASSEPISSDTPSATSGKINVKRERDVDDGSLDSNVKKGKITSPSSSSRSNVLNIEGLEHLLVGYGIGVDQCSILTTIAIKTFQRYSEKREKSAKQETAASFYNIKAVEGCPNIHIFCQQGIMSLYRELNCTACNNATCSCKMAIGGNKRCQPALRLVLSTDAPPKVMRAAKLILLSDDEEDVERFENEMSLFESLGEEPSIARLWHFHVRAGTAYFQYYNCGSLTRFLAENPHIKLTDHPEILHPIFLGLLQGLGALEERNLVHNDIKEDNLLIDKTEESYRTAITDLGTAMSREEFADSLEGGIIDYYSPQKLMRDLGLTPTCSGFKDNVWAMGCTMHFALFSCMPRWCNLVSEVNHLHHMPEMSESERKALEVPLEVEIPLLLEEIGSIPIENLLYWGAPNPRVDKAIEALGKKLFKKSRLPKEAARQLRDALHSKLRLAWERLAKMIPTDPFQRFVWAYMLHPDEAQRKSGKELIELFQAYLATFKTASSASSSLRLPSSSSSSSASSSFPSVLTPPSTSSISSTSFSSSSLSSLV